MKHFTETIVDREVGPDDADRLSRRVVTTLVEREIIRPEPTHCVLPAEDVGYPPGPNWHQAIIVFDEYFLDMQVNGLQVLTDRQIFDAGDYQVQTTCPTCGHSTPLDDDWRTAARDWKSGNDDAPLNCPACNTTSRLTAWQHDPTIGFGNLGLRFWNWPELNEKFVESIATELGHPVYDVDAKLET